MHVFKQLKRILLINTGGTIAAKAQLDGSYGRASLKTKDLLRDVKLPKGLDIELIDLEPRISHNMTIADRFELASFIQDTIKVRDNAGVILTHGTNTLPETAFFLDLVLPRICPIVLTGAIHPFGSPDYDGRAHLQHASQVLTAWPKQANVLIVFNGEVHSPTLIYKTLTPKGDLTLKSQSIFPILPYSGSALFQGVRDLPWVPIYMDHPGGEMTLDLILAQKPQGLVVVGAGEGFINEMLAAKIKAAGITTLRTSKITGCPTKWRPGYDDRYGTIPAGPLTPEKAQILLGFALAAGLNLNELLKIDGSSTPLLKVIAEHAERDRIDPDKILGI